MEVFLSVFVVVLAGAGVILLPLGLGGAVLRRVRVRRAYDVDPAALDADTRADLARLLTREAAEAFARGRYDLSARACRQVLRLDPEDPSASRQLVASLFASGDYDPARQALERHLAAFPQDEAARLVPVAIACEKGDFVAARTDLDAMDPARLGEVDRALWFNNYAFILASLEVDLDLALEYGQRALNLAAPADRQFALRTLGLIYLARGAPQEAERSFREALQHRAHLRPGDLEHADYHLALALQRQGRVLEANRVLERLASGSTPFALQARVQLQAGSPNAPSLPGR
jgi:tetratricopeptide (TPR) repeat protein